jgi:hypothetical protein
MEFQLSEETLLQILTLKKWKEEVMGTLATLLNEGTETKAAIAAIGTAVTSLISKYDEAVTKLMESVTPEQMAAAKVEFDEAQADAQAIVDVINARLNPPPPAEPPTEPLAA